MSIIIEVGANSGSDTEHLLKTFPTAQYYGFEPTIELYVQLQKKFAATPDYDRMQFIPCAVSETNGFAQFNIAGQGDWGCSSLYEFNPNIHTLWQNRSDFKFTHSYKVPTIRLDTFIANNNLQNQQIDYLWIDAQGHDIPVLNSLGKLIDNVCAGRLEVSYTVELYQGTVNTLRAAEDILIANKFEYKITPDDVGKEANITFIRYGLGSIS